MLLRLNTIERKIDNIKLYLKGTDYFHTISDVHYKISNLITDFEEEHGVRTSGDGSVVYAKNRSTDE